MIGESRRVGPGLVVDAVAEREQAEPLDPLRRAVEPGHRFREPAQRAGREPAEDDPGFPGFAQDRVDAMRAPDAEQADHAAAADVDQVLREEVAANVLRTLLAPEQRDVAGLAAVGREGAVEADDVVVGVAAGRGQEADARPLRAPEAEHVVVEQRVSRLHREAAAAEGDDLSQRILHTQMVAASGPTSVVQRSEVRAAGARPRVQAQKTCCRGIQRPEPASRRSRRRSARPCRRGYRRPGRASGCRCHAARP